MKQHRIELLLKLKKYILQDEETFKEVKDKTERQNGWFTQLFIHLALENICSYYLDESRLLNFAETIQSVEDDDKKFTIGITMAGNIPLVGFHDFLCVFLSGHKQKIKFSSKDDVLLPHFIQKLYEWDNEIRNYVTSSEMLKGCDAYIATGSNNSAKYFEFYFAKYPHIIRKNRTSVAILTGDESTNDLENLADDVYQYFGLGCRNVTKLFVHENYDFIPLLNSFKKYDELKHHNKYRNNYDYNLALYMLNNQLYMSNESVMIIENKAIFSAISVLHYETYPDMNTLINELNANQDIQVIVGNQFIPFGKAQTPSLHDFADGVNTVNFLNELTIDY